VDSLTLDPNDLLLTQIQAEIKLLQAQFLDSLADIAATVGPDIITALREAHDDFGYDCAAHRQSQHCCVDLLTDSHLILRRGREDV